MKNSKSEILNSSATDDFLYVGGSASGGKQTTNHNVPNHKRLKFSSVCSL